MFLLCLHVCLCICACLCLFVCLCLCVSNGDDQDDYHDGGVFPDNWPQAHYHYHNHDGDVYLFLLIIDLLNLVVSTCAQAHTLLLVPGGKKC